MNRPFEYQNFFRIPLRIILFILLPFHSLSQVNNGCGTPTTLISSPLAFNTPGGITALTTYTAAPGLPGACAVVSNDVWYTFVAHSTNPTITVTQTSGAAGLRRSQIFSGNCALLNSLQCSGNSNTMTAAGLTPGQTYLIRVYGGIFNFTISITDPNDLCGAASNSVLLTSGLACNVTTNIPGNMYGATLTAPTNVTAPNCAAAATRDVWYRFVAHTTNPTITLSNIGAGFTNPGIQILTGACAGASFATQIFCGTTSINANWLTPGTTYFIRVYSTAAVGPANPSVGGFDICITDPVSPAPSNDECTNAANLSVGNLCTSFNINQDMSGSTPSAQALGGTCPAPNAYDMWYKFTAINSQATVSVAALGANFVNPRIEIFSGNCGALTSIFCGASPQAATGLTTGNTYYVRVYSPTPPPPNGNARFTICVVSPALPVVRFGNSYVNISKKTTGGVVETGDTLEIRMTIQHSQAAFTMTNLRFVDNIPTNTVMLTGPTDRIRIITNEGLMYKEYTPAAGDDAATYLAAPPVGNYNIRMNLGFGGTVPSTPINTSSTELGTATGSMDNGDNPRGGGGLLFAVAYRVRVTGAIGSTVSLNPAQFIYRFGGVDVPLTATPYQILVSEPLTLCANSIGLNNATEFGGTFGSGNTLNRTTDLTTPIPGYSFLNNINGWNGLGDGRYALVKNISPRNSTNRTANRTPNCAGLTWDDPSACNKRMHGGHWDIDGDHTGTNNAIGNVPPADGTPSGYMLMVNADYVASEVYSQTLNNLCPNTYYEFSAWFRNICPTCGVDSIGAQMTGTPTAPAAGYPGVYPNLSFALNGFDYYNTGEIDLNGWQKKGFVFRTGPTQTSASFSIRNNSQGGGGNDWVMDDIAVATCLPTMSYSPTINPIVCEGNPILISDTISSFFRNYTTFKWQRSIDAGANWTDLTGVTTLPDTNYYVTSYTVPPAFTTTNDDGDLYRVVVATTAANLLDVNCNISDGVTITLNVQQCGPFLDVNLISFSGKLVNSKSQLYWTTSAEDSPVTFKIERSTDGRNFTEIGEVQGKNKGNELNYYSFIDPLQVTEINWYRIRIVSDNGKKKQSSIIQIKNAVSDFEVGNIVNPFANNLSMNISMIQSGQVTIELIDMIGNKISSSKQVVHAGSNSIQIDTQSLAAGVYTLKLYNKDKTVTRRVIKKY